MTNQKSIFKEKDREDLILRISNLSQNKLPLWGKMNIDKMIHHCILWDEMALGKMNLKHIFLGRLFGKIALRSLTKDDKPLQRNMSTIPELHSSGIISDFEILKKN